MAVTLRLQGEKDEKEVNIDEYTVAELRDSCEYLRSLLDFGGCDLAGQLSGSGKSIALQVDTGTCSAALAASILHYLVRGAAAAPLQVDGGNAAELLSLADRWCLEAVKAHVLKSLRKSLCNGFRRPAVGSCAIEAVPHVATLAHQALEFGVGDADGGLRRLYDDCTTWMAAWPARAWPNRTFAGLQRAIQDDVLAAAKRRVDADSAPAVLADCRRLSGMPSVAWARRVAELRADLTSYTMSFIWSNFTGVCVHAGTRRDRAECWGALLEELRAYVAENPSPDAAVSALCRWGLTVNTLLYGKTARRGEAWSSASRGPGAEEGQQSWLGEEDVAQLQDLYDHVRSYCVRHMSLVTRCSAFRALPRSQKQLVLQMGQEGVGVTAAAWSLTGPASPATAPVGSTAAAAALGGHCLSPPSPGLRWQLPPSQLASPGGSAGGSSEGVASRVSASWVISGPSAASAAAAAPPPPPLHAPSPPQAARPVTARRSEHRLRSVTAPVPALPPWNSSPRTTPSPQRVGAQPDAPMSPGRHRPASAAPGPTTTRFAQQLAGDAVASGSSRGSSGGSSSGGGRMSGGRAPQRVGGRRQRAAAGESTGVAGPPKPTRGEVDTLDDALGGDGASPCAGRYGDDVAARCHTADSLVSGLWASAIIPASADKGAQVAGGEGAGGGDCGVPAATATRKTAAEGRVWLELELAEHPCPAGLLTETQETGVEAADGPDDKAKEVPEQPALELSFDDMIWNPEEDESVVALAIAKRRTSTSDTGPCKVGEVPQAAVVPPDGGGDGDAGLCAAEAEAEAAMPAVSAPRQPANSVERGDGSEGGDVDSTTTLTAMPRASSSGGGSSLDNCATGSLTSTASCTTTTSDSSSLASSLKSSASAAVAATACCGDAPAVDAVADRTADTVEAITTVAVAVAVDGKEGKTGGAALKVPKAMEAMSPRPSPSRLPRPYSSARAVSPSVSRPNTTNNANAGDLQRDKGAGAGAASGPGTAAKAAPAPAAAARPTSGSKTRSVVRGSAAGPGPGPARKPWGANRPPSRASTPSRAEPAPKARAAAANGSGPRLSSSKSAGGAAPAAGAATAAAPGGCRFSTPTRHTGRPGTATAPATTPRPVSAVGGSGSAHSVSASRFATGGAAVNSPADASAATGVRQSTLKRMTASSTAAPAAATARSSSASRCVTSVGLTQPRPSSVRRGPVASRELREGATGVEEAEVMATNSVKVEASVNSRSNSPAPAAATATRAVAATRRSAGTVAGSPSPSPSPPPLSGRGAGSAFRRPAGASLRRQEVAPGGSAPNPTEAATATAAAAAPLAAGGGVHDGSGNVEGVAVLQQMVAPGPLGHVPPAVPPPLVGDGGVAAVSADGRRFRVHRA